MREGQAETRLVRPLRGGQITIPAVFRQRLGIDEQSLLQVTLEGEELRITPVHVQAGSQPGWLRELYDDFAPVRQEAIDRGYTEAQIDEWIDEAVEEVRARRARKSDA